MQRRAVLLTNLGSPDAAEVPEVRAYLKQFLMDPYVIQLPWFLRTLIVHLLVLPSRPAKTAKAYHSIWSDDGSPLVSISMKLKEALQDQTELPVSMAMRYGKPSIETELKALAAQGQIEEVLFLPLYPHYADSTVTTAVKEAERVIRTYNLSLKLKTLPPFYDDESYIQALVASAKKELELNFDHVLFSYHGLPESHIVKADPTGNHCLKSDTCCSRPSPAHASCYRHQLIRTTQCFAEQAGLKEGQFSIAYQSRLGRAKWLEPSTEASLVRLAEQGVKRLLVLCPAFVTDCLETLEEINIQGREIFIAAGGENLRYIPCLNTNPEWIACLANWVNKTDSENAA